MADNASFLQLSESIQNIQFLKDTPEVSEDERAELEQYLSDLASRQESKFDAIISMIKKCDTYIVALENEMNEIQANLESWKKNKQNMINIIKFAYQQNLIGNKPTGIKYQAIIRKTKPRLVDNFSNWDEVERAEFSLRKTTIVTRVKDEAIVDIKHEELPDKDRVREELIADSGLAPVSAQLIPGCSFTYERRKRLTAG
jgi:hypothetical protein